MFLRRTSILVSALHRTFSATSWSSGSLPDRMAATLPRLPVFEAIAAHDPTSTVVVHSQSRRSFTYGELLSDVAEAKERLLEHNRGMEGERVAFLVENSYDYVVTLLSILSTHSIALPLSPAFPASELQYILDQSQASLLLSSAKFSSKATEVLAERLETPPKHIELSKKLGGAAVRPVTLEGPEEGKGGLMLYTSGTTNRPKGVLLPSSVMTAQALSLKQAWQYAPSDHLLHVLPLHHIHGTINGIFTPLFAGSAIEFLFPFNATSVWERLAAPFLPNPNAEEGKRKPMTFFTVVPTVYNRLLSSFSSLPETTQSAAKEAITPTNLRINISGSAALPTPTKAAWSTLSSGNVLLERYGMTEVGMALSCGLPFSTRVDGSVGWALPSVEVRLVDTETGAVIAEGEELDKHGKERDGEIQLRGPTVFREYWRNPEATKKEFVDCNDGQGKWFKTGDVAVRRAVPASEERNGHEQNGCSELNGNGNAHAMADWCTGPMYFIRGRLSADIIKTGGEKVSALEVERELLSLPQVEEAAVVAVPSGKWGQKVGVVVVLKAEATGKKGTWGAMDMRRALAGKLARYKIPQVMRVVDEMERNAMGKINKKQLVKKVFKDEASGDEM